MSQKPEPSALADELANGVSRLDSLPIIANHAPATGFQRLRQFFGYLFAPHDAGEKLPPPPIELVEWAQDTLLATFAGMIIGGGRQWIEERAEGRIKPPAGATSSAHAARAIAEEQTQRLLRVFNAATRNSIRFGSLAATFYGTQMIAGIYRGQRDYYNTAVGGLAAGAVLGLSLPRRAVRGGGRFRAGVLGAALGACIGIPAGLLQDKLRSMLPEEYEAQRLKSYEQTETIVAGAVPSERPPASPDFDPAIAVIRQLEASLESSPTRQPRSDTMEEDEGGNTAASKTARSWKIWQKGDG